MQHATPTHVLVLTALCAGPVGAEDGDLADYFGFTAMDVVPIGDNPGPMKTADMDGDGLLDVVVANNHRSRIEILRQKPGASPDDPVKQPRDINEFPDHWRFERTNVPLADAVNAIAIHDLDGDGRLDLIVGGPPGRITMLRQVGTLDFDVALRRDVRKLAANPAAFTITDMSGDGTPDLLSAIDGEPAIWPVDGFTLGPVTRYPAGAPIVAVVAQDFDGDGIVDMTGVSPDDAAPVRIWFGRRGADGVAPGPQTVFEMPPIVEFETIAPPSGSGRRIAVVERAARRVVLYDLASEPVETGGDREAAFTVYGFPDPGQRARAWTVTDVDGDGLSDMIAADGRANALAVFRQSPEGDLTGAESSPSLSDITTLSVVPATGDAPPELLVLSDEEGVVGRTALTSGELAFPVPLAVSAGYEPVAMSVMQIRGTPHAAVVINSKRDYMLELTDLSSGDATSSRTVDLGALSRKPDHVRSVDVDQDGHDDLIVLTRDRPMIVLLGDESGDFTRIEKSDMGQYGLVAAAGGDNTAVLDVDGDGADELLVADGNFVRALVLERDVGDDRVGWRVVRQFNADDPDSEIVSVTPMDGRLVAADRANQRLLVFAPTDQGTWDQVETLRIRGFTPGPLAAGTFAHGVKGVFTIGEDGFAIIPFGGQRRILEEAGSWRSTLKGHVPHELAVGDINADGYGDMVALDAGEQMMELFTFDGTGEMLHATGFQIYESRLFSSGDSREYQPREVIIADVSGDGAHDIVMLVHDRIIIYTQ